MTTFSHPHPNDSADAEGRVIGIPSAVLLPQTGHAPGEPLWGAPPRRQPIVPLIVLALVTLLVAAPAALSGAGQSANPIVLMHDVADSTYRISGLMVESNRHLAAIDTNTRPLERLEVSMVGIAAATEGMADKTVKLDESLAGVGGSVSASNGKLKSVDSKLAATAETMGGLRGSVGGSLRSTRTIVGEFTKIDTSIGAMDSNLKRVIALMSISTPQTKAFSENRTRRSIAGGDGRKYGVPNIAPGNRVMSVMLPMIHTMQSGGTLVARKESATPSNPLIGALLKRQVPDGTNVAAIVQPFDGYYGLPGPEYFVTHPINGF